MSGQTSVNFNPDVAIEGMVSRTSPVRTRDRVCNVTAGVQNGRLVVQDTRDGQCRLPAAPADIAKAIGIAPYRATQMPAWPPGTLSVHYPKGQTIGAISGGRVWVKVEADVAAFGSVFVRYTVRGGLNQLGAFGPTADTVAAVDYAGLLAGAVYLTSATAGNLALVELNLP